MLLITRICLVRILCWICDVQQFFLSNELILGSLMTMSKILSDGNVKDMVAKMANCSSTMRQIVENGKF